MRRKQRVDLGYSPHPHQTLVHAGMAQKRFGICVAHRRFGKTKLACHALLDAAFRFPGDDGHFAYLSPFRNQTKRLAWPPLRKALGNVPGVKRNESDLKFTLPNHAEISLFGADNPDSMRGTYFDGLIVDESAQIKSAVWDEVILPALADRKGWCMFIGTPKGVDNLFYKIWKDAHKYADDWFRILFRADETNLSWLDDKELATQRRNQSDAAFRQEYLCDWEASNDNILITIDLVRAAMARQYKVENMGHLPKVIGVDVARFGGDSSVIFKRHGLIGYEPIVLDKIDNMRLAARVAQEIHDFKPDAVFIDGGRGEGVIDRLRQLGYDVIEVNFGGTPTDPRYRNKRTEMYFNGLEWLEEGGMLPDNFDLLVDLTAQAYNFTPADKLELESKDKVKERIERSPDISDAWALTFAEPVAPKLDPLMPGIPHAGHQGGDWEPDFAR